MSVIQNSEMSVVQGLLYYGATIRTWVGVEVSALQRCPLREVPKNAY